MLTCYISVSGGMVYTMVLEAIAERIESSSLSLRTKLESSDIVNSVVNVSKETHGYIHGNPVFNNDTGDTSFVVER